MAKTNGKQSKKIEKFDVNGFIYLTFVFQNGSKSSGFASLEITFSSRGPFKEVQQMFSKLPKHLLYVYIPRVLGDRLGMGNRHKTIRVAITNPWHAEVVKKFLERCPDDLKIGAWKGEDGPYEVSPRKLIEFLEEKFIKGYYNVLRDLINGDVVFVWDKKGHRTKYEKFLEERMNGKFDVYRKKVDELFFSDSSGNLRVVLLADDVEFVVNRKRRIETKIGFLRYQPKHSQLSSKNKTRKSFRIDWDAYRESIRALFVFLSKEHGSFTSPLSNLPYVYVPLIPFDRDPRSGERKKIFRILAEEAKLYLNHGIEKFVRFFDNRSLVFLEDVVSSVEVRKDLSAEKVNDKVYTTVWVHGREPEPEAAQVLKPITPEDIGAHDFMKDFSEGDSNENTKKNAIVGEPTDVPIAEPEEVTENETFVHQALDI